MPHCSNSLYDSRRRASASPATRRRGTAGFRSEHHDWTWCFAEGRLSHRPPLEFYTLLSSLCECVAISSRAHSQRQEALRGTPAPLPGALFNVAMGAYSALSLPEVIPLLPVRGRVLLPSSVLRVVVASPRSIALVESLLRARASQPLDGVWLGVASLADGCVGRCEPGQQTRTALSYTHSSALTHLGPGTPVWNAASADNVATVEVDGEQVHAIGCAARVLQVSKTPSRDRRCVFLL